MASVAINNTDWLMRLLSTQSKEVKDAVFQKLASIADVTSLNKQERLAYDENLRKYRDTIEVMQGQYMEGEAKGRADVARKLKEMGMALSDIAKATGLSETDIEKL